MKIRFQREAMLSAFQMAAAVAPSRSPKPILERVKITATDGLVVLTATDMEIGVRVRLGEGLEVENDGMALLPVDRFGSMLRESSDEELTLKCSHDGNQIQGQRSRFKLSAEDPGEFPEVAAFSAESYHQLPGRLCKELIRRTLFATDTESGRFALGGVLLEFEPELIVAVGTDGRRLAKMQGPATQVNGHTGGDRMTIIPSRSLNLIERAITDLDAEVQIATRDNDVLVQMPHATYFSRLVEGRFPTWRDVLPANAEGQRIELTVGPTYAALRQAAVMTDKESRGITFSFGDGGLVLATTTADVGESHVEMPINYEGSAITVKLDHRYVSEFLRVLSPDATIVVHVQGKDSPARFTTADGYDYVIMPMAHD